jgi:hypothetical protein
MTGGCANNEASNRISSAGAISPAFDWLQGYGPR